MKLLFLGTGAAGWSGKDPALCDFRGIDRRCTSLLIDDCILVDPNAQAIEAIQTYGVDPLKITSVLISHSHGDHFSAETLKFLADTHKIDVYGDDGYLWKLPESENLTFHAMKRRKPVNTPFGRLTAVLSTHDVEDTEEFCLHYILERDGKTLFYGPDGAWFGGGTWYEMELHHFDIAILDATFGDDPSKTRFNSSHIWFYHNSASMLKTIRDAMFDKKIADDKTLFVADHLSGYYYPNIEECHKIFDPMGYIPAFDGLILNV